MFKKIMIGVGVVLVCFFLYVTTRPSYFNYERSGVINAPAHKIYPYISQLRLGEQWSPYEKKDPQMKKEFIGEDATVGTVMTFAGNKEVGAGSLEILSLEPNSSVDLRLIMTEPMNADHKIHYRLTPVENGTRFTWSMEGDGGFLGKLMTVLIDCEAMIGGDLEKGIENLKALVEEKENTLTPGI